MISWAEFYLTKYSNDKSVSAALYGTVGIIYAIIYDSLTGNIYHQHLVAGCIKIESDDG
jgi:cellobiose-specific phosphotransferase system component IIC